MTMVLQRLVFAVALLLAVGISRDTSAQTLIVLTGDYADPSIVRVGQDFYMTHTSHSHLPGLLVWHSTDLLHWEPIARALRQNVGTVWAPDICYYDSLFYIYFPTSMGGNYVITAPKAEGPWSRPTRLDVSGIDPGHIVGNDGQRYLYVNAGRYVTLSPDGLQATSSEKIAYDGWQYPDDWAVECFCLESPKLFYHNGYYYMVSAQGGTSGPSTGHMAVVARANHPEGPWENSPYNPLVHTYSPSDQWVSRGHATLFDDADGQWYAVYHAYPRDGRPQGRATLIQPISWTSDGWPIAMTQTEAEEVRLSYANTQLESDDFDSPELGWQWVFYGIESDQEYELSTGSLSLHGSSDRLKALMMIASEADYEITVKLDTRGDVSTGLVLMYNEQHTAGLSLSGGRVQGVWQGKGSGDAYDAPGCRFLRLRVEKYTIQLSYSNDGVEWQGYPIGFDVSGFHTNVYSGFHSLKPAILCRGEGDVVVHRVDYKSIVD